MTTEEWTPEKLSATFASALHSIPFDRDEWVQKFDKIYQRMLGTSLATTGLPDHPAYIAVHKATYEWCKLRYNEYGNPPTALKLLMRAAKAPKEAQALSEAFKLMELVDAQFVESLRLLLKADIDGSQARRFATKVP